MKNRVKTCPKRDSERHWREKTTKIASGAVSGRTFSSSDSLFVDLGVPAGTQNGRKTAPKKFHAYFFTTLFRCFNVLFAPACSGSVPDQFWSLQGRSRTRFCEDFATFCCRFRRDLGVVRRVPPGGCRDTPSVYRTHSAGFLWGTAISRSGLNKNTTIF